MNDKDLAVIQKEIRDGIQNAITLIAANVHRGDRPFDPNTPPPLSGDEVRELVDKRVGDTGQRLARRDEQLLDAVKGGEARTNERIDRLVLKLPAIVNAALSAAAPRAVVVEAPSAELVKKQTETNARLRKQTLAIVAAFVVPTAIGIGTTIVNRLIPPPGWEAPPPALTASPSADGGPPK